MIGRVLRDPHFLFPDGERGIKLLVVLAASRAKDWIIARTTSQADSRSWTPGCCMDAGFYPGFFIPKGKAIFDLDTWICLDYVVEFDPTELAAKLKGGRVEERGEIARPMLCELLKCAYQAQDITQTQSASIRDTIASLGC